MDLSMSEQSRSEIAQAVFHTILYSDVFDFPLNAPEVHRYLVGISAPYADVCQALNEDTRYVKNGKYYTLIGREDTIRVREQREAYSKRLLPYAMQYGRFIGSFPFVRMVSLTGSLAVMNVSNNADFDYMLVARAGRLWTARAFVLLFGRLTRLYGHIICPNLIVGDDTLQWHQRDLYSARELCQMIPVSGSDMYQKLMKANEWVKDFLPHAYMESTGLPTKKRTAISQKLMEIPWMGRLGDRFENWEMNRKIARFSRLEGFGEETIFNAAMCQGNFDRHREWIKKELQFRMNQWKREPDPTKEGIIVNYL
jgi:hypothetical protein